MLLEKDTMEIEDLKQLYRDCDTFFICSTQNQIVNFIPLVNMLEAKAEKQDSSKVTIYNITYSEENERNKKWDENLIRTLNECEKCTGLLESGMKNKLRKESSEEFCTNIKLSRHYDQEDYREEIEKKVDGGKKNSNQTNKNIIWNLTGGQRSVLLTILKIIEEKATQNPNQKHTVLYMEGNTNRFVVGTYEKGEKKGIYYRELDTIYGWEHLTIEMVFGLAGFRAKCTNQIEFREGKIVTSSINMSEEEQEKRELAIKNLWKYYKDKKYGLVENFLKSQLSDTDNEHKSRDTIWSELEAGLCQKEKEEFEDWKGVLEEIGNENKLGYWLEYMLYFELKEIIKNEPKYKDYFLEIGHSVSLNPEGIKGNSRQTQFSEFDVVLLSKSGQVIIFECKSGAITSEVSKARIYTSYAAAGVYGTPILIPPYLYDDENDKVNNANKGVWGKMNTTRKAAQRAGMDIWCLDQLKSKISHCVRG